MHKALVPIGGSLLGLLSVVAIANVSFNLPAGHTFTVKNAGGGPDVLIVNSNGELLVNGQPLSSIVGQTGPQGPQGAKGNTGATGATGATGTQGPKGDTGATGAQGLLGPQGIKGDQGEKGEAGVAGKTILSGLAKPTTEGTLGDYYLDTDDNRFYGPKTASGWGPGVSLIGMKGDQGPQGLAGDAIKADPPCFSNDSRIADCGNGTIADSVTGLIWLQNPECVLFGDMQWAAANNAVVELVHGDCGLTDNSSFGDWRIPTADEWRLSRGILPATDTNIYWSATTDAAGSAMAMTAKRDNGIIPRTKSDTYGVWPVRGGPAPAVDPDLDHNLWRYQPMQNGWIIKDLVTGLIWTRCAGGKDWNASTQTCDDSQNSFALYTWNEAMELWSPSGPSIILPGAGSVRLPTISELMSLVYCSSGTPYLIGMKDGYYGCSGNFQQPAIVSWAFPGTPEGKFWSSSSNLNSSVALYVNFANGIAASTAKDSPSYVRLVVSLW